MLVWGLVVVWWIGVHATCQPLLCGVLLGLHLFFSTAMCVAVNVAVHTSSHSCHMYISAPDLSLGGLCAVLDPVY